MNTHWIALREAKAFVRLHHSHNPRVAGGIIAVGCFVEEELVGVAILGRGDRMDSPSTCQISRVCTNGYPNACSKLYSVIKRVARLLGFTKIKTFTLQEESGASLRAVQAVPDGTSKGGDWSRTNRPRETVNTDPKNRWLL